MNKTLALLLLAAPLANLQAAKINPAQVPADSRWVLHVDLDAFKGTTLGKHVLNEIDAKAKKQLQAFEGIFGINLENGLHGATAFGNGEKDKGVLLIHADADKEKLLNFAILNDKYEKSTHGKHEIHSLPDDKKPGKRNFFCFYNNGTVVAGPGADLVTRSVDVLDGEASSLTLNEDLRALGKFVPTPVALGYGDFSTLLKHNKDPKAEILKKVSSIGLAIGEQDGVFKSATGLAASDEESATQVENLIRGIVALGALTGAENPEVAKLANAVKVKREANFVTLRFEMNSQELIALLETLDKKKKGKAKKSKKE